MFSSTLRSAHLVWILAFVGVVGFGILAALRPSPAQTWGDEGTYLAYRRWTPQEDNDAADDVLALVEARVKSGSKLALAMINDPAERAELASELWEHEFVRAEFSEREVFDAWLASLQPA